MFRLAFIFFAAHAVIAVPPRDFYEDQIAEESIDHEDYFTSYASLPKHIFNDGKPFVVGKDPVTGQIDFSSKKTVSSSTPNDILDKDIERPSDINKIAPNIHDFLNLPVKYSSSKSVYPLISSSYSNLKYQGHNNKYNHKNSTSSSPTTTTTSPKYYTNTMIVKSTSIAEMSTKRPFAATSSVAPFTVRSSRPTPKIFTKTTTLKPTTNKYDTKKYQDSGLLRKKSTTFAPILVETHPKKNNSVQLETKLNVIPITKASTTTKEPETTSTTPSTAVRFPSDMKVVSPVTTIRPTEAVKTPKPTKKTSSLSDLFSLWSEADDEEYYDEKLEETKAGSNKIDFVEKKPELNFVDAPVNMLPNDFKTEKEVSSTASTTTTTTKNTTPKPTTTISDVPTTYSPKTTIGVRFGEKVPSTYLPSSVVPTFKPHQTSVQEKQNFVPTQTIQEQNYVTFGNVNSAPSRNTFVIQPGQDSASIVLGSQQSFGTEGHFVGSAEKQPIFEQNTKFPGQVINENIPQDVIPQGFSIKVAPQPGIRFPNNPPVPSANPVSFENEAPIIRGTISNEINPQSLPLAAQPQQNLPPAGVQFETRPVENKKMPPTQMSIEIIKAIDEQLASETDGSQVVFKDETPQMPNLFPPSQDLTPPVDGQYEVPQFFERPAGNAQVPQHIYGDVHRQDQRRPPQQQQQQMPQHQQQTKYPQGYKPYGAELMGNGKPPMRPPMSQHQMGPQYRIDRIPNNNQQRPIPDRMLMQERPEAGQPLPNILPQFRPNAKTSHGHMGPKKEAGIIRVNPPQGYGAPQYYTGKPGNIRGRPSPTFILRRNPNPHQGPPSQGTRFVQRVSYPDEMNANRRHYNAGPPMNMQYGPMQGPPRFLDPNHPAFRRHLNAGPAAPHHNPHPQQMQIRGEQELLNRNDQSFHRFMEERQNLHQRDNVPMEKVPRDDVSIRKQGRLEPVVTLQMLHAKKLAMQEKEKNVELPVLKEIVPEVPVSIETASDKKNVYVVYPLKEENEGEKLSSKVSSVTSTGPEYQNTPFSIANTHVEQEPILTLKEKSKPIKTTQFPYHIEKPINHKPAEEPQIIRVPGQIESLNTGEQSSEIVTSKISTTLTRVTPVSDITGSPIAFAFTPTPRPINHKGPHIYDSTSHEMYSMPNIITHESQTEQTYFHDYDYDHHVKEPFQAPFYASANLPNKATPSNVFEGWAIVTQGTPPKFQPNYDNNKIDRADTNVAEVETETSKNIPQALEMTTKTFDPDHFQPEFLTGFQPIYTADTNVKQSAIIEAAPREEPFPEIVSTKDVTKKIEENHHSTTEKSKEVEGTSTTSTMTTTKKPAKEIDSLEAFFNALVNYSGDDDDRRRRSLKQG